MVINLTNTMVIDLDQITHVGSISRIPFLLKLFNLRKYRCEKAFARYYFGVCFKNGRTRWIISPDQCDIESIHSRLLQNWQDYQNRGDNAV